MLDCFGVKGKTLISLMPYYKLYGWKAIHKMIQIGHP